MKMKTKLVVLSLLFAGISMSATAQTKEKFNSERFMHNWFISVAGGAQVDLNKDNRDYGIADAITPNIAVSLGKYFTPELAVRGQVAGVWSTLYSNVGRPADSYLEIKNKNFFTVRADAIYNLTNAIAGYRPDRLFSLSIFGGPGMTFAKTYDDLEDINPLVNISAGLMGQFNLNKYLDINIEARAEANPTIYGVYSNSKSDVAVSLLAGLTYTFGGKKFVACGEKVDTDGLNAQINRYRQQLADAEAELAAAKRALANVRPEIKETVKEIEVAGPRAIFFMIGKSVIDDYGMVNIQLAAKIIKANANKKYKIAGYADRATGSAGWNQKLSERRAQAVYDALLKEGVSSNQLELIGHGGTDNMFGKNKLQRVVILE